MAAEQGARACWFSSVGLAAAQDGWAARVQEEGGHESRAHAPLSTLLALERTIRQRREQAAAAADAGEGSFNSTKQPPKKP